MYRTKVQRLAKEIAGIDKNIAKEQKNISDASAAINRTKNQSTKTTKQKAVIKSQKKIGKLQEDKSRAMKSYNTALGQLERLEKRERKKSNQEEMKHVKAISSELSKQEKIGRTLNSTITVNFQDVPEQINVLFLASNPVGAAPLRLDIEIRSIQEKIRASEYRESINLHSRWAVRSSDLLQAINEVKPHIIHFSGHGSSEHDIVLETAEGEPSFLSKEKVTLLMKTMSESIKLVIFNNCFSNGQAEMVTEHVDFAIGMNEAIQDEAAKEFAAQFYSALGFGHSVQKAFEQGKLALSLEGIEGNEIPELYSREGLDPNEHILVKPDF